MKEQLLPIGTRVFDIRFGWGKIVNPFGTPLINQLDLYVEFPSMNGIRFGYDYLGKDSKNIQMLSLTEYDLVNGGFTPLSDYNKPKVGDFGFFWNNRDVSFQNLVYSKLIKIDIFNYDAKGEVWENFSKEIPDWFLKKK